LTTNWTESAHGRPAGWPSTRLCLPLIQFCITTSPWAPWNIYFGGRFHPIPGWTGRGGCASSAPAAITTCGCASPLRRRAIVSPLKGIAFLCTPGGEKFRLHFGGVMPRRHGADLRGVPIHLYLYNWPLLAEFGHERRPEFDLYGTFGTRSWSSRTGAAWVAISPRRNPLWTRGPKWAVEAGERPRHPGGGFVLGAHSDLSADAKIAETSVRGANFSPLQVIHFDCWLPTLRSDQPRRFQFSTARSIAVAKVGYR